VASVTTLQQLLRAKIDYVRVYTLMLHTNVEEKRARVRSAVGGLRRGISQMIRGDTLEPFLFHRRRYQKDRTV
jgi:hypothetical protein